MNPFLTKTSLPPPPLNQWLRLIKITSLFLVPHLQHTPCIKAHTPAHIWNPHPTTLSHPTFLLQFLHSPILGWQSQSKPTQVSSTFTYTSGFSQGYFELVLEDTRTRRSKVAVSSSTSTAFGKSEVCQAQKSAMTRHMVGRGLSAAL